jgi:hypothetical protein
VSKSDYPQANPYKARLPQRAFLFGGTMRTDNVCRLYLLKQDVRALRKQAELKQTTINRLLNQVTLEYLVRLTGLAVL